MPLELIPCQYRAEDPLSSITEIWARVWSSEFSIVRFPGMITEFGSFVSGSFFVELKRTPPMLACPVTTGILKLKEDPGPLYPRSETSPFKTAADGAPEEDPPCSSLICVVLPEMLLVLDLILALFDAIKEALSEALVELEWIRPRRLDLVAAAEDAVSAAVDWAEEAVEDADLAETTAEEARLFALDAAVAASVAVDWAEDAAEDAAAAAALLEAISLFRAPMFPLAAAVVVECSLATA